MRSSPSIRRALGVAAAVAAGATLLVVWQAALTPTLAVVEHGRPSPASLPPLPSAADFPDDVPPGTPWNGRRKPHPDDVPPTPPSDAEIARWRAELTDAFEVATAACGLPTTLHCGGGACVVQFTDDRYRRVGGFVRRPVRIVEQLVAAVSGMHGFDSCLTSAQRLDDTSDVYLHARAASEPGCHGYVRPGDDHGRREAAALCTALATAAER